MNLPSTPVFKPLYVQLVDLLVGRLASGEWPPGQPLPSESALAVEYQVSQGTLRKALDELAARRLVVRQQGRGTFAAKHNPERSLFQFFHLYGHDGQRKLPTSAQTTCRRAAATAAEATQLAIQRRESVFRIFRIRQLGGGASLVEAISVAAHRFPGLDKRVVELPNALYAFYEMEYSITIASASERLTAVKASAEDARALGVAVAAPLLQIDRTAADIEGQPVEWRRTRCDCSQHYYLNQLD